MSEAEIDGAKLRRGGLVLVPSQTDARERDHARAARPSEAPIGFDRRELRVIFDLYGAMVAAGEWRDYALDFTPGKAVFSIFRRSCEAPLYRIEKDPALARRQGMYSVIATGGLVLRRGHDLARVIRVIDKARLRAID